VASEPFARRRLLMGAAALAAAPFAAGCSRSQVGGAVGAGDTLERIRRQGKARVAFANEAPYGYKDTDGKLVGEAPSVARRIFEELGVTKLEAKLVEFGSLIPALQAGAVDIIAAGMFITPKRCKSIAFSEPDYTTKSAFLVRKGNPDGILSYEDAARKGIKLGVLGGAIEIDYAKAAGVNNLVTFTDAASGFEGLDAGRADAFSLTSISLQFLLDHRKGVDLEVTEPFVPQIDGKPQSGSGGYGFRTADTGLRDEFNKHLAELKTSGELLKIIEPYGFSEAELPPAGQTTETLCAG
jgi:ectoine/hydroxyectoine ABC transporter solute-binding protein